VAQKRRDYPPSLALAARLNDPRIMKLVNSTRHRLAVRPGTICRLATSDGFGDLYHSSLGLRAPEVSDSINDSLMLGTPLALRFTKANPD